jgi:hypothetical protein
MEILRLYSDASVLNGSHKVSITEIYFHTNGAMESELDSIPNQIE